MGFLDSLSFEKYVYNGSPGGLSKLKELMINYAKLERKLILRSEFEVYLFADRDQNSEGIYIEPERYSEKLDLEPLDDKDTNNSTTKIANRMKMIEYKEKHLAKIVDLKSFAMGLMVRLCSKDFLPVWNQQGMDPWKCWRYLEEHHGDRKNGAAEYRYQMSDLLNYRMSAPISFSNYHVEFSYRAKKLNQSDNAILSMYLLKEDSTVNGLTFVSSHLDEAKKWIISHNLEFNAAIDWLIREDNYWRSSPEGKAIIESGKDQPKDIDKKTVVNAIKRERDEGIDSYVEDYEDEYDNNVCFNCKGKGHKFRECPHRLKKDLELRTAAEMNQAPPPKISRLPIRGRKHRKIDRKSAKEKGSVGQFKGEQFRKFLRNKGNLKQVRAIFDEVNDEMDDEVSDTELPGNSKRIRTVICTEAHPIARVSEFDLLTSLAGAAVTNCVTERNIRSARNKVEPVSEAFVLLQAKKSV